MNKEKLNSIANMLSTQPKGILAADESTNTITKRFDTINVESNNENRRKLIEQRSKSNNDSSGNTNKEKVDLSENVF